MNSIKFSFKYELPVLFYIYIYTPQRLSLSETPGKSASCQAAEDSSPALTNGHKVRTSDRPKITS